MGKKGMIEERESDGSDDNSMRVVEWRRRINERETGENTKR